MGPNKKSLIKEEIEFAFDLGVDDDNEAFDTVTIHIFKQQHTWALECSDSLVTLLYRQDFVFFKCQTCIQNIQNANIITICPI